MTLKIRPNAIEQDCGPFTFPGVRLPNDGLHILDTDDSHHLIISPGSNLSADRVLTITTGDAARTITLSGSPTLGDWFDQGVKQADSPTFGGLTLNGALSLDGDLNFQGPQSITTTSGDLTISPADQVYFTTFVGIGTNAPDAPIHILMAGAVMDVGANTGLVVQKTSDSAQSWLSIIAHNAGVSQLNFGHEGDEDIGYIKYHHNSNYMSFGLETAEIMRFIADKVSIGGLASPDGTLHVHTATAGAVAASGNADDLVVENSDSGGISILTPADKIGGIYFGDPGSNIAAGFIYDHANTRITMSVETANILRLYTTGLQALQPIKILEAAAAVADTAGYGQLWVKTATPNQLWFTDDAGNDVAGLYLGALAFTGATTISTTTGNLTFTPTDDLRLYKTAAATFYIDSYEDNAALVMRGGLDGNAENAYVWFYQGTTMKWSMGNSEANAFSLYGYADSLAHLLIVSGSHMYLRSASNLYIYPLGGALVVDSLSETQGSLYVRSQRTSGGVGAVIFQGHNDAAQSTTYGQIQAAVIDDTDGSESGEIYFYVIKSGTLRCHFRLRATEAVFNEDSQDVDFRVESNDNANMFFIDGGTNRVGIGRSGPDGTLHVQTATAGSVTANAAANDLVVEHDGDGGISILSTATSDANIFFGSPTRNYRGGIRYDHSSDILSFRVAETIRVMLDVNSFDFQQATTISTTTGSLVLDSVDDCIYLNSGVGYVYLQYDGDGASRLYLKSNENDIGGSVGVIYFQGDNDAAQTVTYAYISSTISDDTDGTEDGNLYFYVISEGASANILRLYGGGPNTTSTVFHNSQQDGDGNLIFRRYMRAKNDAAETIAYTEERTYIIDNTDGTEDGEWGMYVVKGGTIRSAIRATSVQVVINEDSIDMDFRAESNAYANMFRVNAGTDTVGIGTGTEGSIATFSNTGIIFNEQGLDRDFRVESDGNVNMFFVDGGANRVGIGTNVPSRTLDVRGGATFNEAGIDEDFRVESVAYAYMFELNAGANSAGFGTGTAQAIASFSNTGVVFNEDSQDRDFRVETDGGTHTLFVSSADDRLEFSRYLPAGVFNTPQSATVLTLRKGAATIADGTGPKMALRVEDDSNVEHWAGGFSMAYDFTNDLSDLIFQVRNGVGDTYAVTEVLRANSTRTQLAVPLFIKEAAAAVANIAGFGQLWVRDDAPNTLMFTDDAGNHYTVDLTPV